MENSQFTTGTVTRRASEENIASLRARPTTAPNAGRFSFISRDSILYPRSADCIRQLSTPRGPATPLRTRPSTAGSTSGWQSAHSSAHWGSDVSLSMPQPRSVGWDIASSSFTRPPPRATLPPRELVSAAIRRILEEPPPRRVPSPPPQTTRRYLRRRSHRTAPTSGYSNRYPPGLLSDSSDEGLDTDWYPRRWEDVLGEAVANLPPTHFYRSWRTNSQGLLRYLLGDKLEDEDMQRTRPERRSERTDECDEQFRGHCTPYYMPVSGYLSESRGQ